MVSVFFCTAFEGVSGFGTTHQEGSSISQIARDSFSCIKKSTTELALLPSDFVLEVSFADCSTNRWMVAEEFRRYWEYRDTVYMIDALHFLIEKFCLDRIGDLETAMSGRKMSVGSADRALIKVFDQSMDKYGKSCLLGFIGQDCIETQPEEAEADFGSEFDGDNSWQDEEGDLEELCSKHENDTSGSDIFQEQFIDEYPYEDASKQYDKNTFSDVIDFYHVVLFRIAHFLTPKDCSVFDTVRSIEVDLLLALNGFMTSYVPSINISEASLVDENFFVKMKEAYRQMLFIGKDFLHVKLMTAWAHTVQLVNDIATQTGKNKGNLSYLDFEKWFEKQGLLNEPKISFNGELLFLENSKYAY